MNWEAWGKKQPLSIEQFCLPDHYKTAPAEKQLLFRGRRALMGMVDLRCSIQQFKAFIVVIRSEERRVGKEC